MTHAVRIGCSGWNYRSWREPVYDRRPASEWLERYAERFDTVEVNASFYRLPTRHATQRWAGPCRGPTPAAPRAFNRSLSRTG